MRLEMARTFPVPRQKGWDYAEDFHSWHEWINLEVIDPEEVVWEKPGDTVRVVGKMMGIRLSGSLILEEVVAPELSRKLYRWPGWPDIHMEQHYAEAGSGAFTVRVVAYGDDEAGWLGKSATWLMTRLPIMMRREVRSTFDRLDIALGTAPEDQKKGATKARATKNEVA
jgi:hypothetical protein